MIVDFLDGSTIHIPVGPVDLDDPRILTVHITDGKLLRLTFHDTTTPKADTP